MKINEDIICKCVSSLDDFQKYLDTLLCHENFKIIRKLKITDSSIKSINFECLCRLPHLTLLSITFANLSCIDEKSFVNHHDLVELSLEYNSISKLTSNVFDGLKSLEVLNLGHNKFQTIDNTFSPLKKLKRLSLHGNKIETIETNAFQDLGNLEELNLEENDLRSLGTSLRTLTKLKILNLGKNKVALIEENTFKGLDGLKELFFQNNDITRLDLNAFANLKCLTKLDLKNNKLGTLDKNIFASNRSVEILDLENVDIKECPDFSNLINLQNLCLSGNKLISIGSNTFKGLSSLLTLKLNNNKINEITCGVFEDLKSLYSLDLSENELKNFEDQVFGKLPSLRVLNLSWNLIEEVDGIILKNLMKLKMLQHNGNMIEHVETNHFPESLEVIELGINELKTLVPCNFSSLKNLRVLTLRGNPLDFDDDSSCRWFDGLEQLQILEIDVHDLNHLSRFSQQPLPLLKRLHISVNKCTTISPDFFEFYPSIKIVKYYSEDADDVVSSWRKRYRGIVFADLEANKA